MQPRKSARSNKGQHSQWSLQDVLRQEQDDDVNSEPRRKKSKVESDLDDVYDDAGEVANASSENDDDDDDDNNNDKNEEDGEVRCTPCGANKDNYDEETDEGGTMIECDKCHTWQHAKCMGYRNERSIPKKYMCNLCQESKSETKKKPEKEQTTPGYSFTLRDKTRISVAKAFFGVFHKNIPPASLPDGIDAVMMATKWAQELEAEVFKVFPLKDKHYTDKSRGLMVLIKKENVMRRISTGELSFYDLVNSSPEEIDEDLKVYAEKVRQESIRRSVLTVDEGLQRIRRTHKGEEIVEDANRQLEEADVNVVPRNIDHRRIKEDSPPREIITNSESQTYYHNEEDDDDDEQAEADGEESNKDDVNEDSSDLDDDELDMILKDKKDENKEEVEVRQQPAKPAPVPAKKPLFEKESAEVWKGEIVFPDFASFSAVAELKSCTNYVEPSDSQTARNFSRFIKVGKELLSRKKHEVEGRLDKNRADDYLNKVVSSRDFYLIEIKPTANHPDYDKLYGYLLDREKVGVLSGKPSFAKDSYLIALEKSRPLPPYLSTLKGFEQLTGLFALYVVRKGYVPAAPSILKNRSSYNVPAPIPPTNSNHHSKPMLPQPPAMAAKPKTPLLDSILSTLGGAQANPVPKPQPIPQQNHQFQQPHFQHQPSGAYNRVPSLPGKPNLPSKPTFGSNASNAPNYNKQHQTSDLNLSGDQMRYLQELVKNNPQQARHEPQALVGMAANSGASFGGSGLPAGDDDDEFPTYN
ncbi:Transcription factor bye1 [Naganishia cerealis]|uniref:Transcription factor bye1 n=1 Tax=Naganishia cerealis TaxID=610337 RepID=A0ACC2V406_9TREE|nr:Transcription factor bye1 [Naganishia cerealis]